MDDDTGRPGIIQTAADGIDQFDSLQDKQVEGEEQTEG